MQDLLLIDADALWHKQLSNQAWVNNLDRIMTMRYINAAPTVPAVPLADHERMKRG